MIKAVVFDLDNTLIDRKKAFLLFCDKFIDKYSNTYPYEVTRQNLIDYMVEIDGNGYGGLENFIPKLNKLWKLPLTTQEFIMERNRMFGHLSIAKPGLHEVLKKLKQKYRLAMITNGYSKVQRDKLATVGINGYFEDIIVSEEEPYEKPDTRIFLLSCSHLGIRPEEMIYVGDYYPNDIEGAINAKIKPIWINENPDEQRDDYDGIRIDKLTDLLAIL